MSYQEKICNIDFVCQVILDYIDYNLRHMTDIEYQVQNILPEDLQDNSSLQFRSILREERTRVGIAAFSFTVTNPFLTSDNNTSTNNVVCA